MKKLITIYLIGAIFFVTNTSSTKADILTFDDIYTGDYLTTIPNGYGGFNWEQFGVIKGSTSFPGSGHDKGTVSGEYVAFNILSNVATIYKSSTFDFNGAYLTAAWRDELFIKIDGYLGSTLLYTQTVTVDNTGPTWFIFDFCCIDRLVFSSWAVSGSSTHFAMDNFTFNENSIIPVIVDIKPGSCRNPMNVKSKGKLPVAILGSEEFDVSMIDITSIRLASVAPIRSDYEDIATPVSDDADICECTPKGPDGHLDLTLKFNIQDIVAELGEVNDGDELELTLTGTLVEALGGTLIEGKDYIIIKKKNDSKKENHCKQQGFTGKNRNGDKYVKSSEWQSKGK